MGEDAEEVVLLGGGQKVTCSLRQEARAGFLRSASSILTMPLLLRPRSGDPWTPTVCKRGSSLRTSKRLVAPDPVSRNSLSLDRPTSPAFCHLLVGREAQEKWMEVPPSLTRLGSVTLARWGVGDQEPVPGCLTHRSGLGLRVDRAGAGVPCVSPPLPHLPEPDSPKAERPGCCSEQELG